MRLETNGQWAGKWIIDNSKTGCVHLILDSEAEADHVMDEIRECPEADVYLITER
jgi:hypothetical protein